MTSECPRCCGNGQTYGPTVTQAEWDATVDPLQSRVLTGDMTPHREAAMQDSRVLNWHKIDEKDPPTDRPYYAAWLHTRGWSVYRVDPTRPSTAPAWTSHWAPDLLGLPFRA